jgi:NAD(P)-dependent dehydrogenase (short-subunit alcohol dehydrogenase family)
MRDPNAEKELTMLNNVKVIRCDVTDADSIDSAVIGGIEAFGNIDVLVNNAGYYAIGPLENASDEQVLRQIDTNLTGSILVTKRLIPHFREKRSGVIMNVSSIAGLVSIPMQSLYHATKWGLEGFSESLHYELRQFNIRVKIIEPGVIKTDF